MAEQKLSERGVEDSSGLCVWPIKSESLAVTKQRN